MKPKKTADLVEAMLEIGPIRMGHGSDLEDVWQIFDLTLVERDQAAAQLVADGRPHYRIQCGQIAGLSGQR